MLPIKIGVVGLGKIARDQHLPTLAANPAYELTAIASPGASLQAVPQFESLEEMLDAVPQLDAVALCAPPAVRHSQARLALSRGKHVLLEKPPGATLTEVEDLTQYARDCGRALFATWHSRCAAGVAPARECLAQRQIQRINIAWKEDVRVWHPGQDWIWQPGGLGVFDPGINALSIATTILPNRFFLRQATLYVPENRQSPIAANLSFTDALGTPIQAEFDFRRAGPPLREIDIVTDTGRLTLAKGGSQLFIDDRLEYEGPDQEYTALYARFAELIGAGASEVDVGPLRHVADAFLYGRRETVAAFWE